jgi:hypothetical protein
MSMVTMISAGAPPANTVSQGGAFRQAAGFSSCDTKKPSFGLRRPPKATLHGVVFDIFVLAAISY